jgi:hypothetical protein
VVLTFIARLKTSFLCPAKKIPTMQMLTITNLPIPALGGPEETANGGTGIALGDWLAELPERFFGPIDQKAGRILHSSEPEACEN